MEVVHVGKGVFVCGNNDGTGAASFVKDMQVKYVLVVALTVHRGVAEYCRSVGCAFEHMPLRQGATPNAARVAISKIKGAIGKGAVLVIGETMQGKARRLARWAVTGEEPPRTGVRT